MKNTKLLLVGCFSIFFSLTGVKAQVCFTPATDFFGGGSSSLELTSADFNGDGIPDLAVTNNNDTTVSILLGNGAGGFGSPSYFCGVYGSPRAPISADFNGDGKADLAVINTFFSPPANLVSVFLGNGSGSFSAPTNFNVGNGPTAITSADFNGDGNMDLATSNWGSVSVLLGNGAGDFSNINTINTVVNQYLLYKGGIIAADFNGDGKMDLAASTDNVDTVFIFLGNGLGSFGTPAYIEVTTPGKITFSDFNGDGEVDLAVAIGYWNNLVAVLLGNGAGGFGTTYFQLPLYSGNPSSVISADFNYDGKSDLALSNSGSSEINVCLGDGLGGFNTIVNFPLSDSPSSIISTDFNGDGKADLATANDQGNASVLLNCNSTTSIANLNNIQKISIFPNPGNGKFQFTVDKKLPFEIYNATGKKVLEQKITNEIDLSNLPKGIYFVKIYDGYKIYTEKVVIQ